MNPDVLIVGAGPSGAVTALRLAQDGFRVTVLEQGDWPDYTLTSAIVAAYYFNPEVCERIGYAGQQAIPLGPPDHEALLDSVVARGPVYRPTP